MKNFLHEFFGNIAVKCIKKGGKKNIERSFKWVRISMAFATDAQKEYFKNELEKILQVCKEGKANEKEEEIAKEER